MTTVLTPETLENQPEPTFFFVGVTTGSSSIMTVFPRWAEHLGLPPRIAGIDIPLDAPPEVYRRVVEYLRDDPNALGALVTTHKLNLYKASRDLFDEVGESAAQLDEISSISKRGDRLLGHAMDDVTAGLAYDAIVGEDTGAREGAGAAARELLLLGAGGSSLALTLHLHRLQQAGQPVPTRIVVTNRRPGRLDEMRAFHDRLGFRIPIDYVVAPSPEQNDEVLSGLAPGAIVVNATGLGKDRPGSPLTDAVGFPDGAVAWDFNYRGDLVFLDQARRQAGRGVHPVDGWFYFLHGWTRVMDQVFDLRIPTSGPGFDQLSEIARR
ncbi:shikimate dehydrogenase [Herbiconiux moechotypicola]|uniref:Shikimate dehydrogenase n=1 Tax=Herbiconiux moechotypicola TaxID=637393 RepID=A0ABN3DZ87_9MICO|nr:shikimate dehydrogenase [Herbiconiux moechotypicola]MCS5731184.1 shikimate dehydrogenase [Herbiconiux moechotypicola]